MTDYVTIATAQAAKKGSIIVKVLSLGELKSGASDKGPWSKQVAVIKDNSTSINLTLWNEDIGKLEQGKSYMLETPYWSEYKGETQISLGKFCKIHDADEIDLLDASQQQTITASVPNSVPESTPSEPFIPKHLDITDIALWHSILDKLMEYDMLADMRFAENKRFDSSNPAHMGQVKNWAFATFQEFKKLQAMKQSDKQETKK